jgi:hypothetical protein
MADWTSNTGDWAEIATKERKKTLKVEEDEEEEPKPKKKTSSKRDALNKIKSKRRLEEEEPEEESEDENPLKRTTTDVSELAKTAVTGMVTLGTLGLMSDFMKRI